MNNLFYLNNRIIQDIARDHALNRDHAFALNRDHAFALSRDHAFASALNLARDRDLANVHARARGGYLDHDLARDRDRDRDLTLVLARANVLDLDRGGYLDFVLDLVPDLDRDLDYNLRDMTLGSLLQEGFRPDLSRSWPPLGLRGLRGQIGDAALAAPWRIIFECESDGRTVRDADPDGTRCHRLIELGYDLVFPMVAIPLGHLRRACPTWRADRRVQPLRVAPFLFPEIHNLWREDVEALKSIFGVPKIYALCPRIELWDKPFDDWSDEDWKTCGRSALWEVTTGRVLWADGAHPTEKMPEIGCPAPEYFKLGSLKKRTRRRKIGRTLPG